MLCLHKHLLFSQAPTFKDRLFVPFGANGRIVYQTPHTCARGKMKFFQKSVLASQKDDNSVKNCNIFCCRGQGLGVRSWSEELELESGGEFLATKNRRCRRCQELEFRVGEWSCRAKLAVERKSERADTAYSPRFREEELSATANYT